MNNIGFIGYGNMGSVLIHGFLSSEALKPEEMIVSSRTKDKLMPLTQRWPGIRATDDNHFTAENSRTLFMCVKPLDLLPVLEDIRGHLTEDTHLVSIAACVTIGDLETLFDGKITKVIPSLVSDVKEGISLVCHNARVDRENAEKIEGLFQSISKTVRIDENEFEVAADFTSCGPGMIAAIFRNFVEAGLKHSRLSRDSAQEMVIATLLGTARLLLEREMGFSELISGVATKGGITEEAVKVLDNHLPGVFDEVFRKTVGKHNAVKKMVRNQRPSKS